MRRAWSACALGAALCVLAAACTLNKGNAPHSRHTSPQSASPAPPLAVGPISFFEQHCARCHGAYGSMYSPTLARLSNAELTRAVDEMVLGPAASELSARDLDALVAFHRSFSDNRPFLAITEADPGALAGETTPGATVTVRARGESFPATVAGHRWRLVRPELDAAAVVVEARLGASTTTLAFPDAAHSHADRPPTPTK